jgi:anti-anti-sigma regulatory factor
MQLSIVSSDANLTCLQSEGQITFSRVPARVDPLEQLVGPDGFAKRVLLDVEKTSYVDSSGVSWMLSCHKNFLQGGGRIVRCRGPSCRRSGPRRSTG